MDVATQLSLHFQVRNVSQGKEKNVEYLWQHWTDFHQVFHQNDWYVTGHLIFLTDGLENVGPVNIYIKNYQFWSTNISKKHPL